MTYQHVLVNYLETYRKKHHLTIDNFIEDITSQRSYYRYIELTQDLPMDVLLKFTTKYAFDLKELLDFLSASPDVNGYLAKIRRFKRLKRNEVIDAYVNIIKHYLNEKQQHLLESLLHQDHAIESFKTFFNTDVIEDLIKYYESGKHQALILEYMIDLGETYLAEHNMTALKKVSDFLENTRKQSSDRYLDYPTTLFLAHLNQENQSSMIPYMLSHLSLHIFFNDHESFKTYVSTMNQHFNLDFSQYFIDMVEKHFQSRIDEKQ